MELDSPLTMIGLIATIFSMVFALAAFITVRRRQARKAAQLPLQSDAPSAPLIENRFSPYHLDDSPPANADTTEKTNQRTPAVFKQAGPQGTEMTSAAHYADDEYIWE